jgi:hypothetical protein
MEDSDKNHAEMIPTDNLEAIEAFWKGQFAKFVYAKTGSEAVAALAGALRSEWAMPHIFRLVLADMLEGGSVRLSEESWTIRAARREDSKQTRARIAVWQQYKEVQELINRGKLVAVACREVASRHGKTQRAVEIAYKEHADLMTKLIEEPRKRVKAAMQRSKALRESLANNYDPCS